MSIKSVLINTVKISLLMVIFLAVYIAGAGMLIEGLPNIPSDPGLIPQPFDLLVFAAGHVIVLALIIRRSAWHGWKLIFGLAFAYYGSIYFMAQIESWRFLSELTVGPNTLRGLFLVGLPPALIFIPLAVVVLGKWKGNPGESENSSIPTMPVSQWFWKLIAIAMAYLLLYFSAGYFIAWQNPAVRAFYGGVDPGSFFAQMRFLLESDPGLITFQFLRGVLWALFALPVIWMTRRRPWEAAILVALLFSVPFNIGHIMPNPLIPDASVRFSHMIETASSNFVFGLIVGWLLHREHKSVRDLLGIKNAHAVRTEALEA